MDVVEMLRVFNGSIKLPSWMSLALVEMLRVRHVEPPVGERDLRHLDLPGVLGQASRIGRPLVLRQIRHHGQVEGVRGQEDEGEREYFVA